MASFNPFKRRQKPNSNNNNNNNVASSSTSSSSSRPGITIGMQNGQQQPTPAVRYGQQSKLLPMTMNSDATNDAGGSSHLFPQQHFNQQQQQQQQNNTLHPAVGLPPESDYRTSLIMPHLTRRFTLLRAPDGTVVTPDTMRAHLRAQRARARAAGQPGNQQHFLTEQEEDEIIEQMRAQARNDPAQRHHQQQHHQQQQHPQQTDSYFGGTDGFGGGLTTSSIGPLGSARFDPGSVHSMTSTSGSVLSNNTTSAADRMGSLTESLGDLKTLSSSSSSGSLFSGRSSERDNAYLRSFKKPGGNRTDSAAPIAEEEEQEEEDDDEDQGALTTADADQAGDVTDAMPGGFMSTTSAQQPPKIMMTGHDEDQHDDDNNNNDDDTRAAATSSEKPRQSQLLSTLSPEAFNRVSMALEEVIGSLSPGLGLIDGAEGDEFEFEAGSTESGGSDQEAEDEEKSGQRNVNADNEPLEQLQSYDPPSSNYQPSRHPRYTSNGNDPLIDDDTADADDEADGNYSGESVEQRHQRQQSDGTSIRSPLAPLRSIEKHSNPREYTPASVTRSVRADGATSPESDAISFQSAREDAPLQSHYHGSIDDSRGHSSLEDRNMHIAHELPSETSQQTIIAPDDRTPRIPQHQYQNQSRSPARNVESQAAALNYRFGGQHERDASASSIDESNLSPSLRARRPTSPDVSSHEAPLISANAIAARNHQRYYFPSNPTSSLTNGLLQGQRTPDSYADGFRRATPGSASASTSGHRHLGNAAAPSASSSSSSAHQALASVTRGNEPNTSTSAARPSEDVPDTRGLFPRPPQDLRTVPSGENLSRRSTNSNRDSPAASDAGISEFERQFEQDTEADDVWATVARNLQSSEDQGEHQDGNSNGGGTPSHPFAGVGLGFQPGRRGPSANGRLDPSSTIADSRPISHIPPAEAATQFEDAGFSVDHLTELQASLVRSASTRKEQGPLAPPPQEQPPPVPTTRSAAASSVGGSAPASPHAAKLEKARSRARLIADRARSPVNGGSHSPSSSLDSNLIRQSQTLLPYDSPNGDDHLNQTTHQSPTTANVASPGGMTKSSSMRSFRSQVLYDVTTSHRPTSPPPRKSSSIISGHASQLPSLHDITMQQQQQEQEQQQQRQRSAPGETRDSESMSQAVYASTDRPQGEDEEQGQGSSNERDELAPLGSGPGGQADYGGLFGASAGYPEAIPEEAREAIISYEEYDADASAPFSPDQSYSQQQNQNLSQGAGGSPNLLKPSDNGQGGVAGGRASAGASPASVQSAWSDRSGKRNIVDDVAAQATAATTALKGPHSGDGGPHIRPKRSKTLSRKKTRKNPGKLIGVPQLLTTSQAMDYAQPIPNPDKTLTGLGSGSGKGKVRKPIPQRRPTDYKNDPKIGPVTLFDDARRASSSFGHEGQLPQSPYHSSGRELTPAAATSSPGPSPESKVSPAWDSPRGPSSSNSLSAQHSRPMDADSSMQRPGSSQNQGNTLGRIMSRMRLRKTSESNLSPQNTVDPYRYAPSPASQPRSASPVISRHQLESQTDTPRGNSPFGLSAMGTLPQRTLPDSGASNLAGMFNSPATEYPPQLGNAKSESGGNEPSDKSPRLDGAEGSSSNVGSGVGLGLDSQHLSPQSPHSPHNPHSPQLGGQNHETVTPGGYLGGGAYRLSPKLGSPLAIHQSVFGSNSPSGDNGDNDEADVSAQTIRRSPDKPVPSVPSDGGAGAAVLQSPISSAATKLNAGADAHAHADEAVATPRPPKNIATESEADNRKSLRDTVVRRTLIFPSDASFFEEKRRSLASISSNRRKSRRHVDVDDEANASYAALMGGGGGGGSGARNSTSPRASNDASSQGTSPTKGPGDALNAAAPTSARQSRYGNSRGTSLYPPSPGAYSRRASGAQSSYAGSLYDMYIGDDGDSVYDGEDPRASFAPAALTGRNHIEVTERADGSVIWQVIAGLGGGASGGGAVDSGEISRSSIPGNAGGLHDRISTYTGYSGHSRVGSDVSQFSFMNRRDSMEMSPQGAQAGGQERTFTGLIKDEDARSLFAKRRASQQPPRNGNDPNVPALPDLALQPFDAKQFQQDYPHHPRLGDGEEDVVQETSRPSSIGGARPSMSLFRPSLEQSSSQQQQQQQQLAFDMATPNTGVTRVVYSNDVELEQLLESLARQNDAAKFHFDPKNHSSILPPSAAVAGGRVSTSTSSSKPSLDISTAADQRMSNEVGVDVNRRRVEDEIMSLLNTSTPLDTNKRLSYFSGPSTTATTGAGANAGLTRIEDEDVDAET
ncbi:unnamed protein product [Sympodiomycopsis kandeliae]